MSEEFSAQSGQEPITQEFTDLLETIKQATDFFSLPPEGFDPRTVSDNDLLRAYGLPPKPDEKRFPMRYTFWEKMFSRKDSPAPVTFVETTFQYERVEPDFGQTPR